MARSSTATPTVSAHRLAALAAAVELEVDEEDLTFGSDAERALWEELQAEFRALVAKIGPVWIAD